MKVGPSVQRSESRKGYTVPPVTDLRVREMTVKGKRLIKIRQVFAGDDEIFLGCGKPNIYLIVPNGNGGYQKFSGKTLRRAPCAIEDTRGWVQSSFLVRFKNLPAHAAESIRNSMSLHHGNRYWNCVNATVRVMQDAGFTVGGKPLRSIYFPDQLMQALFSNELWFEGKPVECEVIRTTSLDIENYTREIVRAVVINLCRLADKTVGGSAAKLFSPLARFFSHPA
jgi:hypothetical protein